MAWFGTVRCCDTLEWIILEFRVRDCIGAGATITRGVTSLLEGGSLLYWLLCIVTLLLPTLYACVGETTGFCFANNCDNDCDDGISCIWSYCNGDDVTFDEVRDVNIEVADNN